MKSIYMLIIFRDYTTMLSIKVTAEASLRQPMLLFLFKVLLVNSYKNSCLIGNQKYWDWNGKNTQIDLCTSFIMSYGVFLTDTCQGLTDHGLLTEITAVIMSCRVACVCSRTGKLLSWWGLHWRQSSVMLIASYNLSTPPPLWAKCRDLFRAKKKLRHKTQIIVKWIL